jgi:hypothetical protein
MHFSKRNIKNIAFHCISIVILLFTIRCASPGSITGGPKDVSPPVLVGSQPEMYATNFKGKKVKVDFDEFIQLKDVNQQFNVSPPMKKKPKVWLKNKTVVVEYSDTLKDSTTYTLSFGNSIIDNNEGNVFPNFEFVFSTGSYVDSLGVVGGIVDAFSLKKDEEPYLIMLYTNLSDSAPYKEVPLFTGRSNKSGIFSVNNVKPGVYRLYGIKDKNFNYKYDAFSEPIAFFDTLVYLDTMHLNMQKPYIPIDTAKQDTSKTKFKTDSIMMRKLKNSLHLDLKSFTEKSQKQFIKDYSRKDRRFLNLVFNNPIKDDSLVITPIYYNVKNWRILEFDQNHDSINVWLTDTSLIKSDTLRMKLEYFGTNKKNDTIWATDTLNFRFIADEKVSKKQKKPVEEKMKIAFASPDPLDLKTALIFESKYPFNKLDQSKIQLTKKVDTLNVPVKFKIDQDKKEFRKLVLNANFEEQVSYTLTLYPNFIENIYNLPTDTIIKQFSVQRAEYYGTLFLTLKCYQYPVIAQLINDSKVAFEKTITKDGKITFDHLPPSEFTLKLVFDKNRDGKYTNGNLLKHIQPEKVLFYKEPIKMRSNWEMDVNWTIE